MASIYDRAIYLNVSIETEVDAAIEDVVRLETNKMIYIDLHDDKSFTELICKL